MKITWTPNPLQTVVELDDHEKRWFRERLRSRYLEARIDAAHFDLDAGFRATRARLGGKEKTLEESVADAVRSLDMGFTTCEEERNGKTLEMVLDEQLKSYLADLAGEHDGDCVCVACSCCKCYAESLLGIGTISGLGKHEAAKIRGFFRTEGVSIEEVVDQLRVYRPVYTPSPNWPESEWQKHVPRWREEARHAFEWLEAYRREHFDAAVPNESNGDR